jgi:hypothetical protein
MGKYIVVIYFTMFVGIVHSQSVIPVNFYLPEGNNGLTFQNFEIIPKITFDSYENYKEVILYLDIKYSTPTRPLGGYVYKYRYNQEDYTDKMLGQEVFNSIRVEEAEFDVEVVYKDQRVSTSYSKIIGSKVVMRVPRDAKLTDFAVHIRKVYYVTYSGTSEINRKIGSLIAENKARMNEQSSKNSNLNSINSSGGNKPNVTTSTPNAQDNSINSPNSSGANSTSQSNKNLGQSEQGSKENLTNNSKSSEFESELAKARKAIEEAENRRVAQAKRSAELTEVVSNYTTAVVTNIMADIQRNQETKYKNELISKKRKEESEQKANLILNNYLSLANKGSEEAILKVAEAYEILENPNGYYYRIETCDKTRQKFARSYSEYPKEYLRFLIGSYSNFESSAAKLKLENHYEKIINFYKVDIKVHKRKAISRLILGSVLLGLGTYGSNYLFDSETILPNNSDLRYSIAAVVGSVGILGGPTLLLSSFYHTVGFYSERKNLEYLDTQKRYIELTGKSTLGFRPKFDLSSQTAGVAFQIEF